MQLNKRNLQKLARLENVHLRLIFLCIIVSNRFTISAHQIYILMAFSLSPRKNLSGKFCLSCLNRSSICHRFLQISAICPAFMPNRFVTNSKQRLFSSFQYAILRNSIVFRYDPLSFISTWIISSLITPLLM